MTQGLDHRIRPATVEEAELLSDLILRSKAYWGYDAEFMNRCRTALAILPEWIVNDTFFVIEKSEILGFYSLRQQETTAELTDLFVEPTAIGFGYGKQLWQHAIAAARSTGAAKLLIKSDPHAAGFYQKMGARQIGQAPSEVQAGRMLPLLCFDLVQVSEVGVSMIPGEMLIEAGEIELNVGRPTVTLLVANTGDRPIQIGSHFHFFEVNRALSFDRDQSRGMRLDIPAGTAVRFEPGDEREVTLVTLAGSRQVYGFNGLINGSLDQTQDQTQNESEKGSKKKGEGKKKKK